MEEKKKGLSLVLSITEPTKTEKGWEVVAMVALLYGRYPAEPTRQIVFMIDGEEIERAETDEESGQAKTIVLFPQSGNYLLTVFVAGLPGIRRDKKIFIKKPEEKPKKPAKLLVYQSGQKGEYDLMFQVLTGDDSPVVNATVRIVDPKDQRKIFDLPATAKDGVVSYRLSFTEKLRMLTAVVAGTEINEQIHLFN